MTLEELDAQLAQLPASPKTDEDLVARAKLMARRIELDNAARSVRDAAAGGQPARGNLVVNVPGEIGLSHFYGNKGRVVCARMIEGVLVLDLFLNEFRTLLSDRRHGLAWQKANDEAVRYMGEMAQRAR